jgi:hypothetical protein
MSFRKQVDGLNMQQTLQKYTFSENKVFTASWMEGRNENGWRQTRSFQNLFEKHVFLNF